MLNKVNCPVCNHLRSDNFKEEACPNCGRKMFLFFGYRTRTEIKMLKWMLGIMSTEVIVALIAGILYYVTTQSNL